MVKQKPFMWTAYGKKNNVFKTSKRQCFTIFGSSLFVFDHVLSNRNSFRNNKNNDQVSFQRDQMEYDIHLDVQSIHEHIFDLLHARSSNFNFLLQSQSMRSLQTATIFEITINGLSSQLLHCFGFMKSHRTSRKICALE